MNFMNHFKSVARWIYGKLESMRPKTIGIIMIRWRLVDGFETSLVSSKYK